MRPHQRRPDELRPLTFRRRYTRQAPGSVLVSPVGPFTVAIWGLLIAVIWTVGSGAEYIREAIPILTESRPVAGTISGPAADP